MPKHQEFIDNLFDSLKSDEDKTIVKILKKVREKYKFNFFEIYISNSR